MSFSADVKKELLQNIPRAQCCQNALLAGLISFSGKLSQQKETVTYSIKNESFDILNYIKNLCESQFFITASLEKKGTSYTLTIPDSAMLLHELDIVKFGDVGFSLPPYVSEDCCRRSFLRGAFLGGGTISSPEKQYHLEFSTPHFALSRDFSALFVFYDIAPKTVKRKSRYVTYFKDNDLICDVLALIGADRAALKLSETGFNKRISSHLNRIGNSEAANIDKTLNAAVRQIIAIDKIEKYIGIESLPASLRELARLRLEKRELSLTELAKLTSPPLTKSGVNHRMRKLMELAKDLDGGEE